MSNTTKMNSPKKLTDYVAKSLINAGIPNDIFWVDKDADNIVLYSPKYIDITVWVLARLGYTCGATVWAAPRILIPILYN